MRRFSWSWVGASLCVVVYATPSVADACSCFIDPVVLPGPTTEAVPSNTRVWVRAYVAAFDGQSWDAYCGTPPPVLTSSEGEVALDIGVVQPSLLVLSPQVPLTEGVEYTLVADCPDFESAVGTIGTSFTVAAAADDTPPSTPAPTIVDVFQSSANTDCGESQYAQIDVGTDGEVVLVDVGAMGSLDPATMSGSLSDAELATTLQVGRGPCLNNWAEAGPGASETVRYGAFDLAGNFSGWGEHVLELPPEGGDATGGATDGAADGGASDGTEGCGCRSASGLGGGWALALLVLGVLGPRRGFARRARS